MRYTRRYSQPYNSKINNISDIKLQPLNQINIRNKSSIKERRTKSILHSDGGNLYEENKCNLRLKNISLLTVPKQIVCGESVLPRKIDTKELMENYVINKGENSQNQETIKISMEPADDNVSSEDECDLTEPVYFINDI